MTETRKQRTDISGQRFGRLLVLFPTERRDSKGYVLWHCRCDCGEELDVSYNKLRYGNQKSCGCLRQAQRKTVNQRLNYVNGTLVDLLRSEKTPLHNTTGVKGVYKVRNKYMAKIMFQRKQYVLGYFDDLETAAWVRKEAEDQLFGSVVDHYERWKAQADSDPQWAKENPIRINVSKVGTDFQVDLLPILPSSKIN